MADKERVFAKGVWFNEPREEAPEWVLGSNSYKRDEFKAWLDEQTPNKHGYIKISFLMSQRTGKPYAQLDTYEGKEKKEEPATEAVPSAAPGADEAVPF